MPLGLSVFCAHNTYFHFHSFMLPLFIYYFVLFNFRCFHVQVFATRILQESTFSIAILNGTCFLRSVITAGEKFWKRSAVQLNCILTIVKCDADCSNRE